ncbi:MAG: Mov34/MPN/PAD-1 family protein [Blastocatellia bacterium]|jgi:proteasome lid subunit RPN8/RPN11|nr:Mov34/MPN/PAD-1 family protein [Blastocatellia bacterium]MBN8723299.1 Mov34/MPN/PAD-1 family protein [Acidobacteriota bacterium]
MKFVIKKVNEVEAVRRRLPEVVEIEGEPPTEDFRIFLSRQAREKIFIAGSHNPDGMAASLYRRENERGGVLLGNLYYDEVNGKKITYTAITDAMPADDAQAGSTHVEFDGGMLKKVMEEASDYIQKTGQNARIVGWYHTHPGFGVFMSGTDQNTQRQIYGTDWHIAIVFDPIRRDYGIFYGKDSTPATGWGIFDLIAEGFPPPMKLRLRVNNTQNRQVEEDFFQLKEALFEEFREMFDPIKDVI